MVMVLFNYSIWYFLAFISFLLVSHSPNVFWQVCLATIIGELVEKFGKKHQFWRRPLYNRKDQAPPGLVERWYKTGSFPSGHTIKAIYFCLYLIQHQVFHPLVYLLVVTPLILFRILVGFHYPIDVLGGAVIGGIIFLITHTLQFPPFLNHLVQSFFNFLLLVK